MEDRLYFRQLLSGRDFATTDPIARQMVNFAYLIGDRETRRGGRGRPGLRRGRCSPCSMTTTCDSPVCSPRTITPITWAGT
ncbi:MAG: hypothetical protein R2710_15285 [Acidimicrobiales bacterium]